MTEIPETSPCYLPISQSENCTRADQGPCTHTYSLRGIMEFGPLSTSCLASSLGPPINAVLSFTTPSVSKLALAQVRQADPCLVLPHSLSFKASIELHWNGCMDGWICAQSCPTLCDPLGCNPLGFSVHGISEARIMERVAISSSRESSQPRDWTHIFCVSCMAGGFFTQLSYQGSSHSFHKNSIEFWCLLKIKTNLLSIHFLDMKQSQAGRHVGDLSSGFCSFLNLPTEALHPQLKHRMAACPPSGLRRGASSQPRLTQQTGRSEAPCNHTSSLKGSWRLGLLSTSCLSSVSVNWL